ncbi:MAG: Sensory/regulatory protein RpfC [Acidobacteria bacterium ADurb.Bin340]|nr:MAG: Sensory/regulatory protein RpfC [Acidobacteria bacterium ADurb.Bin340]
MPDPQAPPTFFAPAGRATGDALAAECRELLVHPLTEVLLGSLDGFALILNAHRQVLAANAAFREALALEVPEAVQGLRPGELLTCIHVEEGPDGCGTSEACGRCGAVLAILAAQAGLEPVNSECFMTTRREGVWACREYRVRATPLALGGHDFLVFVLQDISSEKRREALERIFLHDLSNTLHGLRGWAELLQMEAKPAREAAQHIVSLSDQVLGEVRHQEWIHQAEQGGLQAVEAPVETRGLLAELRATLPRYRCALGRALEIADPAPGTLHTDRALVFRVLLNMAINALEATPQGGRVRIWVEDGTCFKVYNDGEIPAEVRDRVFQRTFSTKARHGRGLGTYSMKLLGEGVLGGSVGFESTEEGGTTFWLRLPAAALV